MWYLHIFLLAYVMFLMIWKMCTWPSVTEYFILISSFMLWYCFVFLNLAIQGLKCKPSSQKRTVFTVTRSPIFQPMMIFADFVLEQFFFFFWILTYVRLGAGNFVLVSLPLLVPAWVSAVCPWHPFCSILPAVVCIFLPCIHIVNP